MTYEVEVYCGIEGEYFAFLRRNSPDDTMRRGLQMHILGTYEVSGLVNLVR
tara:strand:+ start:321 stop:473 length:153 start_codon:yes stop_codon:yes gene_type:complete